MKTPWIAMPRGQANWPLVLCIFAAFALSGCALGRSEIDIRPATIITPMSEAVVKIVAVKDQRRFEAAPRDPSTPSLERVADISNPAITARAYARKRGGYGNALGDIVLPEGSSVADLVRSATQKALADRGYRVVDENSPDFARAIPVSVNVNEFWTWITPGFATVSIECRASVNVDGGVLASTPAAIQGYAITRGAIVIERTFAEVSKQALDDLTEKMKAQIKPAS